MPARRRHLAAVSLLNRVPAGLADRFRSGKPLARLVAPALQRALPTDITEVEVRSGLARGLRLPIDPQREKFYWTGAYELPVQRALERLLAPGGCFWDVGAHIGFFSLIASRLVEPSGCVEAFEPVPENIGRLRSAVERNGATNVRVHAVAVTAQSGTGSFARHGSSLMGTLSSDLAVDRIDVHCRTLDEHGRSAPIPDVVKIDVEGSEVDVIRGGLELLRERRPALVIEFSSSARLTDARTLLPSHAFTQLDARHWLVTARG